MYVVIQVYVIIKRMKFILQHKAGVKYSSSDSQSGKNQNN